LIRYLLSKGFARLNKWFVLPINDHSDVKVPNFSFNFNFFLHGDNKVCASVDVQRHRYIYNLTNKDLDKTSPSNGKECLKINFTKNSLFLSDLGTIWY
jgi:hypothetical protein